MCTYCEFKNDERRPHRRRNVNGLRQTGYDKNGAILMNVLKFHTQNKKGGGDDTRRFSTYISETITQYQNNTVRGQTMSVD